MTNNKAIDFLLSYRTLISKVIGVLIVLILLFAGNYWVSLTDSIQLKILLGSIFEAAGLLLVVVACFGRLWSASYICGHKGHTLINEGPYSIVRNPLYFFSFIGVVGIGLVSKSLLILVLMILSFILYYYFVVIAEEKHLAEVHGEKFIEYMNRVPRFIPNFALIEEPFQYSFRPLDFRKTYFDVVWFFIVFLIVSIIGRMHDTSILPSFFTIF